MNIYFDFFDALTMCLIVTFFFCNEHYPKSEKGAQFAIAEKTLHFFEILVDQDKASGKIEENHKKSLEHFATVCAAFTSLKWIGPYTVSISLVVAAIFKALGIPSVAGCVAGFILASPVLACKLIPYLHKLSKD